MSFTTMSFSKHLALGFVLRLLFIGYGELHDRWMPEGEVKYTDVDYHVITDGARWLKAGESPFRRDTYRYSPLLAYLALLNLYVHPTSAKVVFAAFDVLIAALIYGILRGDSEKGPPKKQRLRLAATCAFLWLYNPFPAIIATRGSNDSIACALVIAVLYFVLRPRRRHHLLAGLLLGTVIHFRLYPIGFCLAFFLSLSAGPPVIDSATDAVRCLFSWTLSQLLLVLGTIVAFAALTGASYALFGWQYLYEAILYHLVRQDAQHNFSLFYYAQHLAAQSPGAVPALLLKLPVVAPQLVLVALFSFRYGRHRETLPFALFGIAFVMVTYNSVVTSQYFVWYLSLLPLVVPNVRAIGVRRGVLMLGTWLFAQAMWLLAAYLLEFRHWETRELIFVQCCIFFAVNVAILGTLIRNLEILSSNSSSLKVA